MLVNQLFEPRVKLQNDLKRVAKGVLDIIEEAGGFTELSRQRYDDLKALLEANVMAMGGSIEGLCNTHSDNERKADNEQLLPTWAEYVRAHGSR